ncbi:hypothetical protein BGS_1024 [Beggiatoa sp. SS]|nr:hypothetical protein BGS_1024 [Beggiatoa sp. SS]
MQIIFGHWSTLGYYVDKGVYALDTGCLWGGALTALRLEDKHVFTLPCAGECMPSEEQSVIHYQLTSLTFSSHLTKLTSGLQFKSIHNDFGTKY